jgi:DNA polymerase, archaea type
MRLDPILNSIVRMVLAKLLGKDKGDLVYWYETFTETYVKSKKSWKKKKDYSIKPENLNLDEYKELLLNKLKDSLEITGFNIDDLRSQLSQAATIAVNKFTGGNIRIE